MTIATQTWRCSATYTVTKAGATATVAEILAAVKAMFDAEDGIGSNYWTVSHYSAGNGTLELKRKGTPAGTLATYRALLFGGATPNTAALGATPTVTANTTSVYIASSQDANTTGPGVSYTTGAPYTVTYNPGVLSCLPGSFTTTNAATLTLVECDECFAIVARPTDTSGYGVICFAGAIVAKYDDTVIWGHASSFNQGTGSAYINAMGGSQVYYTSGNSTPQFPTQLVNASNANYPPSAVVWNSSAAMYTGRVFVLYSTLSSTVTTDNPLHTVTADDIVLLPVHLAIRTVGTPYYVAYIGTLRQIKLGPLLQGKNRIVKPDTSTRGYAFGDAVAMDAEATYFDNNP